MTLSRRAFLASVPLAALASRIRAEGEGSGMCLAYTSFAVRMLQGRDILKSTAAALPASALLDLCVRFGAHGGQIDWSQIESHEPEAARGVESAGRSRPSETRALRSRVLPRVAAGVRRHGQDRDGARRHARAHRAAVWPAVRELQDARRVDGLARQVGRAAEDDEAGHRGASDRRGPREPQGSSQRRDGRAAALAGQPEASASASTSGTTSRCSRSRDRPSRRSRRSSSRRT